MNRCSPLLLALTAAVLLLTAHAEESDPLAAWRQDVRIRPVEAGAERHSIHSYFNTSAESPDGTRILYYTSTTADGHRGELRVRERTTGAEKIIATNLSTEDAHRAACQQWVSGGKRVAFHTERDGEWLVAVADLDLGQERVLAKDRLLCWGQANGDLIPLYGKHWNPGAHRDLELCNVATGEIRTVVTAAAMQAQYPEWIAQSFKGAPVSIFFPELNADASRVFFKMASAREDNPRSKSASDRLGLVCYDLTNQRFLLKRDQWGHPAWHPDGRRIVEVGYSFFDTDTGKNTRLEGLPPMGSGHPSASPDGKLLVTDLTADRVGGNKSDWAIVVCDARGKNFVVLHQFNNSKGARSWRPSHPHPVFSPDGKRIYFNVSSDRWTRLHVAEIP